MTTDEYVAVESAGHLTGIPARTLRRWIADGKLPATKTGRKNLVSLRDVERVAAIAGRPIGHDRPAVDLTGHVATAMAGHDSSTEPVIESSGHGPVVSPSARSQLEAIRDEWLRPLIEDLNAKSEEIGRLKAERDAAVKTSTALREENAFLRAIRDASKPGTGAPATSPTGPLTNAAPRATGEVTGSPEMSTGSDPGPIGPPAWRRAEEGHELGHDQGENPARRAWWRFWRR
jgi:excisionase family DNA binding protein